MQSTVHTVIPPWGAVDMVAWDDLVPNSVSALYDSPAWHYTMKDLASDESVVVCAYEGDQPSVVVPAYNFQQGPDNPVMHPATLFGGVANPKDDAARVWEPVTVLGSATGYATNLAANSSELWVHCARVAMDHYGDGTVLVPYMERAVAEEVARHHEAPLLLCAVRSVMSINGDTWEEHLAQMKTSRRGDLRREVRRLHQSGLVVDVVDLRQADFAVVGNLLANTQDHHRAPWDSTYFVQMLEGLEKSELAAGIKIFQCRDGDDIVAVNVTISYRDTLYGRAVGLNYERVGQHAEYFNVLVHAPLRYAIEHGLRRIDMGIGAARVKLQRNAHPVLMWSALLRTPVPWDEEDTHRHNAMKAAQILNEVGDLLDDITIRELRNLVDQAS